MLLLIIVIKSVCPDLIEKLRRKINMRKIYQLSEKIKFKRPKERVKESKQKEKPVAPLRNECSICGNHELLLFKCNYCKNIYCSEHQLPEKHDCQILKKK